MKTIPITFNKKIESDKDDFGNSTFTTEEVVVDGCLVGPTSEPLSKRDTEAMDQGVIRVRVHLPKTFTGDVSDSTFVYQGKTFRVDSCGVEFMTENCPTQWNRYFGAEAYYE